MVAHSNNKINIHVYLSGQLTMIYFFTLFLFVMVKAQSGESSMIDDSSFYLKLAGFQAC